MRDGNTEAAAIVRTAKAAEGQEKRKRTAVQIVQTMQIISRHRQ